MEEIEQGFNCPFCFEGISMLIDLSVNGRQSYIEDCEVCCHPIQITFLIEDQMLLEFDFQSSH